MRTTFRLAAVVVFALMLWNSCSELRDPVPTNSPAAISDVHPAGWLQVGAQSFHGLFIADSLGWDLRNCQACHGQNYAGGIANSSCLTCHPNTPEDCTVCHGGVDNQSGAPPKDLADNTSTTARGVGQHTLHLAGGDIGSAIECTTCHVVPDSLYAAGHIDSELPAELMFFGLAQADLAAPSYDNGAGSCANTYCHGNWSLPRAQSGFSGFYSADTMQGNAAAPGWTDPATGECGSCHGLPPTGHNPFDISACSSCHAAVVDNQGSIIDKSKHVNGMVNVFGQEYPMF